MLYTDGLIETRDDDLTQRSARLRASVSAHVGLCPGHLLDAVLGDMVGERPAADVAALLVRFHPEHEPRPAKADPPHL